MTTITIGDAYSDFVSAWGRPGSENLRLDAVTWLAKPSSSAIPQFFKDISKTIGMSVRNVISLARIVDDEVLSDNFDRSAVFKGLPLAALAVFTKAKFLHDKALHNPDSSGAAVSKIMNGQWLEDQQYKPGLIAIVDDYFSAHLSYYMAVGKFAAVIEVRRATGWPIEKIKDLFTVAVGEIHSIISKIGKTTLKSLIRAAMRGMHFFSLFFTTLKAKQQAKEMIKMSRATRVKKANDVDTDINVVDEDDADTDGTDDGPTPPMDGRTSTSGPENDDQDNPDTPQTHQTVDGQKVFDDPNRLDPEDVEPHAKLKMGREMAFFMLAQAKKDATKSKNQRYREILEKIDDNILVSALQKGAKPTDKNLRPTDLEIGMRMSSFLAFLWQWANRTGVFLDEQRRDILDMAPDSVIRQIISASRLGYWETGDNRPQDPPKMWVDVTRKNKAYGQRLEVVTLIRPFSKNLKTKPHDGRMVIINPDPELRAYFFPKASPAKESIRYSRTMLPDGMEKITCQKLRHLKTSPLNDATKIEIDDDAFNPCPDNGQGNEDNRFWDATDENIQTVINTLQIDPYLIKAAKTGDKRALQVIANSGIQQTDDERQVLEAKICDHEYKKTPDDKSVSPECLNRNEIADLAQLLSIEQEILRKAFRDDMTAVEVLERAISKLSNLARNRAICLIQMAGNRR